MKEEYGRCLLKVVKIYKRMPRPRAYGIHKLANGMDKILREGCFHIPCWSELHKAALCTVDSGHTSTRRRWQRGEILI